jgi:hypothetical protein
VGASTADVQAERNFNQVNPKAIFTTIGDEVAKSKKKSRKQIEKEGRKLIIAVRKETRLDTLRGLRQMMVHGITIDVAALNVMIQEIEEATTPLENFNKEYLDKLEPAGENVWVPKVEDTSQEQAFLGVRDLAEIIGVHKESVYKFLRKNFPDSRPAPGHSWDLTIEMRDAVLEKWAS